MDGFEKWLRSLPLDFIQHMWEFYQEDINDADTVRPIRQYYYNTPQELEQLKRKLTTPMTETDVYNAALDLGVSQKEALKIVQWKVSPTDKNRGIMEGEDE